MTNQTAKTYLLISIVLLLQSCVAAVGTGVAVGAATVVDRRTTGTMIEDQAIELKTSQAFRSDDEIREQAHWNVVSYNTRVLLTGEAATEAVRSRMVEIARNIPKVTHVYNELTIAAPSSMMSRSSDTIITSKVKTRLVANQETKALNIKVVTEKGVVYLLGLVNREQADLATEVTRQTGGVQKVVRLFEYID